MPGPLRSWVVPLSGCHNQPPAASVPPILQPALRIRLCRQLMVEATQFRLLHLQGNQQQNFARGLQANRQNLGFPRRSVVTAPARPKILQQKIPLLPPAAAYEHQIRTNQELTYSWEVAERCASGCQARRDIS